MGCFSREEKGYVEETAKWDYIVSYSLQGPLAVY